MFLCLEYTPLSPYFAYFSVFISVVFPGHREGTLCRICPMRPNSTLPSGHQSYIIQGCPLCGPSGLSCCGRENYCGCTNRQVWFPSRLAARPCLMWRLLAAGGWSWLRAGCPGTKASRLVAAAKSLCSWLQGLGVMGLVAATAG